MMSTLFPSLAAVLTLALLGVIFGIILSIARIRLKVDKDPRIELVLDALPGANCGACGFPGCSGYARKIVLDGADINLCQLGGKEVLEKIAGIMRVQPVGFGVPVKARVHCQGGIAETARQFIYSGPHECAAANEMMGGFKVCQYGCLGFGDCVKACNFDAIHMSEKGLPVVDDEKCVGCGMCVKACPRDIISLVPENMDVYVRCMNREKAPVMKKGCSVGCIGCRLCVKACTEVFKDNEEIESAITVDSFLASINYDLCVNCYKCAEVCPVPVIEPVTVSKKFRKQAEKENIEESA